MLRSSSVCLAAIVAAFAAPASALPTHSLPHKNALADLELAMFMSSGTMPITSDCPLGYDAGGYAGAPKTNAYTIRHANFFTGYANQSGQTYNAAALAARTSCLPGVEYNIGPDVSIVTHTSRGTVNVSSFGTPGGVADPALAANISAINTAAGGSSNCRLINGRAELACTGSTTSGQTLYIEGFDFSTAGNSIGTASGGATTQAGMGLSISATITGPCVIANNNFAIDTGTYNITAYPILISGCSSVTWLNNKAGAINQSVWTSDVSNILVSWQNTTATGTWISRYNAYINCPARCLAPGGPPPVDIAFDYFEGLEVWTPHSSSLHGDGLFEGFSNATQASFHLKYSTFLQPAYADTDNTGLGTIVETTGTPKPTVNDLQMVGNVFIANLSNSSSPAGAGNLSMSDLVELAYAQYNSPTFTGNLLDPTGALYCFLLDGTSPGAPSPTFSGNVVLLSGNPWNKFDTIARPNAAACQ